MVDLQKYTLTVSQPGGCTRLTVAGWGLPACQVVLQASAAWYAFQVAAVLVERLSEFLGKAFGAGHPCLDHLLMLHHKEELVNWQASQEGFSIGKASITGKCLSKFPGTASPVGHLCRDHHLLLHHKKACQQASLLKSV